MGCIVVSEDRRLHDRRLLRPDSGHTEVVRNRLHPLLPESGELMSSSAPCLKKESGDSVQVQMTLPLRVPRYNSPRQWAEPYRSKLYIDGKQKKLNREIIYCIFEMYLFDIRTFRYTPLFYASQSFWMFLGVTFKWFLYFLVRESLECFARFSCYNLQRSFNVVVAIIKRN